MWCVGAPGSTGPGSLSSYTTQLCEAITCSGRGLTALGRMLGQQRPGPPGCQKHLVFPLPSEKLVGYRAPTPHPGTEGQRSAEATLPNTEPPPPVHRPRLLAQRPRLPVQRPRLSQRPGLLPQRPRLLAQRPHRPVQRPHLPVVSMPPSAGGHASPTETLPPGAETTPPNTEPRPQCWGHASLTETMPPGAEATPPSAEKAPTSCWRIQSGLLSFSTRTLVVEDACLLSAGG